MSRVFERDARVRLSRASAAEKPRVFRVFSASARARIRLRRVSVALSVCFFGAALSPRSRARVRSDDVSRRARAQVGLAINCLANIVTRDLARDLLQDSALRSVSIDLEVSSFGRWRVFWRATDRASALK